MLKISVFQRVKAWR